MSLSSNPGELVLIHVFSERPQALPAIATLVLAQGRVPVDELWSELESHPGAIRAGDVLGPRTIEEAVLEGTLAVRAGVEANGGESRSMPAPGRAQA